MARSVLSRPGLRRLGLELATAASAAMGAGLAAALGLPAAWLMGAMIATAAAALAGLVSFASPCVIPLVPGYLGYVTGLTGIDLQKQKRGRMLAGIGLFVLGFTLVFLLMSVVLAQLGALPWLRDALAAAGFAVERAPGFAGKRHMSRGVRP